MSMTNEPSRNLSRTLGAKLRIGAGFLIAGAAILAILNEIHPAELGRVLGGAAPGWIAFGLTMICGSYALRIFRWWLMLRRLGRGKSGIPRFSQCISPFLISIALNNILPLRAGDVIRVVAFRSRLNADLPTMLGTLLIERLLDLVVLLTAFFLLVGTGPAGAGAQDFIAALQAIAAFGSLLTALVVIAPVPLLYLLRAATERWPSFARPLKPVVSVLQVLASLCSPAQFLPLVALSFFSWAFEGGVFIAATRAIDLPLAPNGSFFAMAVATLSTVIPSSPGFVGTYHYAGMHSAIAFGASAEQGLAMVVLAHLMLWFPITLVGLSLLGAERWRGISGQGPRITGTGTAIAAAALPADRTEC
jgi:glycosyltransferase 2 family protein